MFEALLVMSNRCSIFLWPCEDGMDPECGQELPCPSHQPKVYNLTHHKESVLSMPCPKCKRQDGPGGVFLLNGELAYGGTGRWPCKCGYHLGEGKIMKEDVDNVWRSF